MAINPKHQLVRRPIVICGRPHKVTSFKAEPNEKGEVEYGYFLGPEEELQVADNLSIPLREEALLHEIIEAVNGHLDLQMNHTQIQSLARMLYTTGVRYVEGKGSGCR